MSGPASVRKTKAAHSTDLCQFLDRNQKFASQCDAAELARHCSGQSPKVFWLGCSDSRVPEGLILSAGLGEVFVHRNVANLFTPSDTSATAALAYAVNHLKVSHVVVVGHESCGGCAAALSSASAQPAPASASDHDVGTAAIVRWIDPIKQLAVSKLKEDPNLNLSQLVVHNVRAQVENLVQHDVILKAWARGQPLAVHGLVYDLACGKLMDLELTQDCP